MIVAGVPENVTVRPNTFGSAPKAVRQYRSDSTATMGAPPSPFTTSPFWVRSVSVHSYCRRTKVDGRSLPWQIKSEG